MLDIKFIRENPEKVQEAARRKGVDIDIQKLLKIDRKRRDLMQDLESLRAEQNKKSRITRDGKKPSVDQIEELKKLKGEIKRREDNMQVIEEEFTLLMLQVPNTPAEDVPVGKDEAENKIIRTWGEPTKFDFEPKDHITLGESLDIIDVRRAAKVSGARFSYLKGDAVLLEFALTRFAMDTLAKNGFVPVLPPVLIKKDAMGGMGYLEHGGEDDMYVLGKDGLVLIGTAEQSIGPMHREETIDAKNLPLRYAGFSSCFRREAGSYGKDTHGIIRVHQFDKVEMFSLTLPENSDQEHEFLLGIEEELFQALGISYRVLKICTGDLGAPVARKYDIEAWIPSQKKYREVTSTSTTTDFQSRRLHIKYRNGDNADYVHMLNGTAFAMGRTIVAILENYQQKDGTILIPRVLQKYIEKDKILNP